MNFCFGFGLRASSENVKFIHIYVHWNGPRNEHEHKQLVKCNHYYGNMARLVMVFYGSLQPHTSTECVDLDFIDTLVVIYDSFIVFCIGLICILRSQMHTYQCIDIQQ